MKTIVNLTSSSGGTPDSSGSTDGGNDDNSGQGFTKWYYSDLATVAILTVVNNSTTVTG